MEPAREEERNSIRLSFPRSQFKSGLSSLPSLLIDIFEHNQVVQVFKTERTSPKHIVAKVKTEFDTSSENELCFLAFLGV